MSVSENELREAIEGLNNTDIRVRKHCLSVIQNAGAEGLYALLDLLETNKPQMQLIAIRHLYRLFPRDFKPEQAIFDRVLKAMERSASKSIKRELLFMLARLFQFYRNHDPKMQEFMVYLLDNDPEVRLFFIDYFMFWAKATSYFACLLEDEDARVVHAAEIALDEMDEQGIVAARFALREWRKQR